MILGLLKVIFYGCYHGKSPWNHHLGNIVYSFQPLSNHLKQIYVIQLDEHIFQMGWNHQLEIEQYSPWLVVWYRVWSPTHEKMGFIISHPQWWFSNDIFCFHPELWGRWTHFDDCIFFQMGWFKNQQLVEVGRSYLILLMVQTSHSQPPFGCIKHQKYLIISQYKDPWPINIWRVPTWNCGLEAELKHGRLAMFAAVAWPLAEAVTGEKLPGPGFSRYKWGEKTWENIS